MDSLRLCLEIGEGWLPVDIRLPLSSLWSSSSFPKEQWATWPHFVLTALQSDSQYFLVFRLPPPDCTFLEIDASLLESFAIACLFLDSIAYLATWAVRRPILGVGIGCKVSGYLFVGTVDRLWSHCAWQRAFRIRKRPRLNRKYFNRAMIASELCYNGTIYDRTFANEKISRINFCDFAKIAKNAKVKPREIFPLYGNPQKQG